MTLEYLGDIWKFAPCGASLVELFVIFFRTVFHYQNFHNLCIFEVCGNISSIDLKAGLDMDKIKVFAQNRRNILTAGAAGAIILVVLLILSLGSNSGTSNLPTYKVTRGDFRVSLQETGELKAQNSVGISAPRVRTSLQIIYLAPKGEHVVIGDTLIVFDGTELQQTIDGKVNEMEIENANYDKSKSSMASQMADLEAQLQSTEASYRIAELRLEQMQFEADVKKEEQELSLTQSRISLEQAHKRIEQQKIMNGAELKTLELQVAQAQSELDKAKRDLDKMTIVAPSPGLVVYRKIWKGGDMGEVQVGDTPWRGQSLLELPDLTIMEVATAVNEVDVAKIEIGQKAIVIPDAFPDQRYSGEVIDVAGLARNDERSDAEVKVFDVTIQLDSTDALLKPGMTVSSTILINEVPDTLYIPIDAVFSSGDETFVYRQSGSFKKTLVELGIRNDNYVLLTGGLEEGDQVSLVDPTKQFDPDEWTGSQEENNSSIPNMNGSNGEGK